MKLLLEIGTEAIPAGYVSRALVELRERAEIVFRDARLGTPRVRTLATPKRLVLDVEGLARRQEDVTREVQGPRADIAFRDGKPTAAAEGFAKKNRVAVSELERVSTEKGEFLLARVHERGRDAAEVLPGILMELVTGLGWPKMMVWNETGFRFPRPIRWVLCLLDDAVLPLSLAGLSAGRETQGHWLIGPGPVSVAKAEAFITVLEKKGVVLDPSSRRASIERGLADAATTLKGRLVPDPDLLDEVVFLVEHPSVLSGHFDDEFLELPREVVVTAMRSHQRYFAVEREGRLLPVFLVVCDGEWKDASQVVAGNERVLRARLADARFYWKTDKTRGIDGLREALKDTTWFHNLGSIYDQTERLCTFVDAIGPKMYRDWSNIKNETIDAAKYSKIDLASSLIREGKEFVNLQGTIAKHYLLEFGKSQVTANAVEEQYYPVTAGEKYATSPSGVVLSVSGIMDTLTGAWASGIRPSGSEDPYGLRRQGSGLIRTLVENRVDISTPSLVFEAKRLLATSSQSNIEEELVSFLEERLASFLKEKGLSYDVIDSVIQANAESPQDVLLRAQALQNIRTTKTLEKLVVGFKRAANILKGVPNLPSLERLSWKGAHPTEEALHKATVEIEQGLVDRREKKDYAGMLELLLQLRDPIDKFFDDVLVMSEDRAERERRLALLAAARELFRDFFDPARIVIEGEPARAK